MIEWWQSALIGLAGGALPAAVAIFAVTRSDARRTADRRHELEQAWRIRAAEAYTEAIYATGRLSNVLGHFDDDDRMTTSEAVKRLE